MNINDEQGDRWGDPAWYHGVAEEVVGQVEQTVEHDYRECDLKGHAEGLCHHGDCAEVNDAHKQALCVVRPFDAVVHERETDFE